MSRQRKPVKTGKVMDIASKRRKPNKAAQSAQKSTKQLAVNTGKRAKHVARKTVDMAQKPVKKVAAARFGNTASKTSTSKPRKKHFWRNLLEHPLRNHPFAIPVAIFVSLSFLSMVGFVASNGHTLGASDTKVVQLMVDDVEQTVPTRANTVGDLLERMDIEVAEADMVEPSLDTEIISDNQFEVTVHRARAVTVIDENQEEITTVTATPDPREVAEQAGLEVYPEDKVDLEKTFADPATIINNGLVVDTVVIERATPIKMNLYGTTYDVRTHAETVEDLMNERGIKNASVFPKEDTAINQGVAVYVTEPDKKITVLEVVVEQAVEMVDDFDLAMGETQVRKAGRNGKKAVVFEIAADGSKTALKEVMIEEPIKRVVARGRKPVNLNVSGSKQDLMTAAGIPASEQTYVDYIISRESSWNASARNASSGAYGLCQSLPASKMASAGSDWETNPVTQLRWCHGYAMGRYGSWYSAYIFWVTNHWW